MLTPVRHDTGPVTDGTRLQSRYVDTFYASLQNL